MPDKAKRVWKLGEGLTNLYLLSGVSGPLAIGWWCPACGKHVEVDANEDHMHLICPCGQHIQVHLEATLEELQPDA